MQQPLSPLWRLGRHTLTLVISSPRAASRLLRNDEWKGGFSNQGHVHRESKYNYYLCVFHYDKALTDSVKLVCYGAIRAAVLVPAGSAVTWLSNLVGGN